MNLVSNDLLYQFPLGTQESAEWDPGAGLGSYPKVTYKLGSKTAEVTLICDKSGPTDFEAIGENPMEFYKFRLTHRCACWNECPGMY